MKVSKEIKNLTAQIGDIQKRIDWLLDHEDALEKLPDGAFYTGGLDFDRLPHHEIVKVVRALGGKWKKEPTSSDSNKINYSQTIDGVEVRCWSGDPPPSCKLVEIEEHVPEKVIPAHTVKRTKMVCSPGQAFVKLATKENK